MPNINSREFSEEDLFSAFDTHLLSNLSTEIYLIWLVFLMSNLEFKEAHRAHGTTTVGLMFDQGVILASDTRAIAGGYFIAHKQVKKILKIDDHLAMTIAGGVADAQNVVDTIRYHANLYRLQKQAPLPVRSAAQLISNIMFSARLYPYIADILVGGRDSTGSTIFNIDLFGSLSEAKYVSTGSGSPVAYGVLEANYKEGLSLKSGKEIAINAITAAIKRNAGTGDGVDVVYITKDGFFELDAAEKNAISENLSGRT